MMIDAHRVAPKLYVGSYNRDEFSLRRAGFDRVIRVAAELPHDYALDDSHLTDDQLMMAELAAEEIADELRNGKRVMVQCAAGVNRSALIAGIVLVRHFCILPSRAIQQIRKLRVPLTGMRPLSNPSFTAALMRMHACRAPGRIA